MSDRQVRLVTTEPEGILMAATRIIEEDRGAYVGFVHAHNGYYAGDFSRRAHPTGPVRAVRVPGTHETPRSALRPLRTSGD